MDLLSKLKPNFVFVKEIQIAKQKVERVEVNIGYKGLFVVSGTNNGRGIALFWDDQYTISFMTYSHNFIDAKVSTPGEEDWRLTCYYGSQERSKRRQSWELMRALEARSSLSWCCLGDFNYLFSSSEKKSRICHPLSLINGFRQTLEDFCLVGFAKSRDMNNFVEEEADHVLANQAWLDIFQSAEVFNNEVANSDHNVIYLNLVSLVSQRKRRFIFENSCSLEPECNSLFNKVGSKTRNYLFSLKSINTGGNCRLGEIISSADLNS